MKKLITIVSIAAALLTSASCAKNGTFSKDAKTVTVNVSLPNVLGTKAWGEADNGETYYLRYAVYRHDDQTPILTLVTDDIAFVSKTATCTMQLAVGKTYDFVFWADKSSSPYTFVPADRKVTVSYDGATINDDTRDAFFCVENSIFVDDALEINATLKRPFAQVNLAACDYTPVCAEYGELKAKLTIPAYTALYLSDNVVSVKNTDQTDAVFSALAPAGVATATGWSGESFPCSDANVVVDAYLAMAYVLVAEETSQIEYAIYDGSNTLVTRNTPNVPLKANYRTNLYGDILTRNVPVTVVIDPIFTEPENNVNL